VSAGSRDAAKELLGTFRTTFSASLACLVLISNLYVGGHLQPRNMPLFLGSLFAFVTSCVASLIVFLETIPKIERDEPAIVYGTRIVVLGVGTLIGFVAGAILVVVAQM